MGKFFKNLLLKNDKSIIHHIYMEASSGSVDSNLYKSWPQGVGRGQNGRPKFNIEIYGKILWRKANPWLIMGLLLDFNFSIINQFLLFLTDPKPCYYTTCTVRFGTLWERNGSLCTRNGTLCARCGSFLTRNGTLCGRYVSFLARNGSFCERYALGNGMQMKWAEPVSFNHWLAAKN